MRLVFLALFGPVVLNWPELMMMMMMMMPVMVRAIVLPASLRGGLGHQINPMVNVLVKVKSPP